MTEQVSTIRERKWLYEKRARTVIKNLGKKHINGVYAASAADAVSAIMQMIPEDAVVVKGDSLTLDQIGIVAALQKRGRNKIYNPFEIDGSGQFVCTTQQAEQMYRKAFSADVFIAGTNAVTLDGKLVNTDGLGNRVAPMIYGPGKVILAVGANKIVEDVEEARKRIADVAAPLDVRRYIENYKQNEYAAIPCARTGRCSDCSHDLRFCCYTVIIEAVAITEHHRINVVIIGLELGY